MCKCARLNLSAVGSWVVLVQALCLSMRLSLVPCKQIQNKEKNCYIKMLLQLTVSSDNISDNSSKNSKRFLFAKLFVLVEKIQTVLICKVSKCKIKI